MRIEIRNHSITIDGYVNAVGRDSRPFMHKGKKIVEQIKPRAFERALSKATEVKLLLNHDKNRELGSTKSNLELYEDNIGLRAICTITDEEVINKAKRKELRGWSFGFYSDDENFEQTSNGLERRCIENLELTEVSIIDNRKLPVYIGTSIEQRADEEIIEELRGEEFRALIIDSSTNENECLKIYETRLQKLITGE